MQPIHVREISNDEGNRLLRTVRRGDGSVVTWRRAQIVLGSAQGMAVPQIAPLAFTSEDRVREVIHNFNDDGFDSLYPRYSGGRPPKFTLPQRRAIKKVALSRPTDLGRPFSTWSLTKLAVTDDGVTFSAVTIPMDESEELSVATGPDDSATILETPPATLGSVSLFIDDLVPNNPSTYGDYAGWSCASMVVVNVLTLELLPAPFTKAYDAACFGS